MAVEGVCTWYGLADLCAREGLPCVLGHALSMPAIPGGKATNDKLDVQKMAVWLRGGLWPQAAVSPAALRATRTLRRRDALDVHARSVTRAHAQYQPAVSPA